MTVELREQGGWVTTWGGGWGAERRLDGYKSPKVVPLLRRSRAFAKGAGSSTGPNPLPSLLSLDTDCV